MCISAPKQIYYGSLRQKTNGAICIDRRKTKFVVAHAIMTAIMIGYAITSGDVAEAILLILSNIITNIWAARILNRLDASAKDVESEQTSQPQPQYIIVNIHILPDRLTKRPRE